MFYRPKKQQKLEKEQEAADHIHRMAGEREQRRTLREYVSPIVYDITPSIIKLPMNVNNFELQPTLISIV